MGTPDPGSDDEEGVRLVGLARDEPRAAAVCETLHRHVLWVLLCLATACYIDRTNSAFASISMLKDLHFSPATFGLGSGLFFAGYSLSMIPSQWMLLRLGAPRWLGAIVTAWGVTASCFAFMRTPAQFYCLRLLLGVAESGAFPAMWHYLNSMYPPDRITLPYSLIEAAVGFANVAGAPLAAGLLLLDGWGGWHGWQWLFLIEGLPSVLLGLTMPRLLPPDFQAAPFLSSSDKAWLAQTHAPAKKHAAEAEARGFLRLLADAALHNHRLWLAGLAALLKNMAMVGILFWAPIIVNSILQGGSIDLAAAAAARAAPAHPGSHHGRHLLGSSGSSSLASLGSVSHLEGAKAAAGAAVAAAAKGGRGVAAVLLTAVPFVCAAVCAVWLGHRSQQRREKCRHVAVPYLLAGSLFVAFPAAASCSGVLGFLVLTGAITSLTAPNAILNAIASACSPGPASAIGLAVYNSIGNLGGLLGPWLVGKVVQSTGTPAVALQLLGCFVWGAAAIAWHMQSLGL